MKSLVCFFAFFYVCSAINVIYDIVRDETGEEFALVPVEHLEPADESSPQLLARERRQIKWDVSRPSSGGTRVMLGGQGTLFKNDNHRLDGNAYGARTFRPTGPVTVGGGLDYAHRSGSSLSLNAQRTPNYGTDVNARGTANLFKSRDGRTSVGAYGQYDRHFGGPFGTGKPNYEVGVGLKHNF